MASFKVGRASWRRRCTCACSRSRPIRPALSWPSSTSPRAADAWPRLLQLPADAPNCDPADWRSVGVRTLVLANHNDLTHPYAYAERLAGAMPGANLIEVPAKAVDPTAHIAAARTHIDRFLQSLIG